MATTDENVKKLANKINPLLIGNAGSSNSQQKRKITKEFAHLGLIAKNIDDFEAFDQQLEDKQFRAIYERYLDNHTMTSFDKTVFNLLKNTMSNETAGCFNVTGRNKKAFNLTNTYTTGQKFPDTIQIMHTFIIKNQLLPLERQILNLL